jgi:NAD(P)-dependent dehydrogenase (short-subunit alcohol dehydrogenase family)
MNNVTKQVAIVTGGGSGIGLAIAEKFVREGIETVIVGRNEQKLKDAVDMLGSGCTYRIADLGNLDSIPALVQDIVDSYGAIHILVNNAGVNQKKPFEEVTDVEFAAVLHTNLMAVFAISREVVKHMLQQGEGRIINISSMASQYGLPKVIAYTASKSAVEGMTRAMACELSPKGIRVNCIAPGFIETAMSSKALNDDPERRDKVFGRTPMGRLGRPADIANAAWYLATDLSAYVTGTVLVVDGGNSIGF